MTDGPTLALGLDASGMKRGADEARGALGSVVHASNEAASHLALMTLGFVGVGGALIAASHRVKEFVAEASDIQRLSSRFKLPVETLAEFSEAAKLSGVRMETVALGLQHLAAAQQAALADKTGQQAIAFRDLGVSLESLGKGAAALPNLLTQMGKGFEDVEDPTDRLNLALQTLGARSGPQMINFLERFAREGKGVAAITPQMAREAENLRVATVRMGHEFDVLAGRILPNALEGFGFLLAKISGTTLEFEAARSPIQLTNKDLGALNFQLVQASEKVDELRKSIELAEKHPLEVGTFGSPDRLRRELEQALEVLKRVREERDKVQGTAQPGPGDKIGSFGAGQQAFIKGLTDQIFALDKVGAAGQAAIIKHNALAVAQERGAAVAKKFNDEIEGLARNFVELTAVAAEKQAITDLNEEISKVGKTAAEIRQIDFNKLVKDAPFSSVAALRVEFERLNKVLEQTQDEKIFKDQAKALREENALILLNVDAREREEAVLELVRATLGRATDAQKEQIRALVTQRQELQRIHDTAEDVARAVAEGGENAVLHWTNALDVLNNIGIELERIALHSFFTTPLQGALSGFLQSLFPSARGNVFQSGNVIPFAGGGIVDRPTFFPLANGGMAEAGEAGPEGIFPLERGPGGKLGIRATGGGTTVVHQRIVIYANESADGARRSQRQVASALRKAASDGR